MRNFSLITILFVALFSCSDKKTVTEKWPNGKTKRILAFENIKDSIFTDSRFDENGELTDIIHHTNSILTGDWVTYKNGIKTSSSELIKGRRTLGKVTIYYKNGSPSIERYFDEHANLYQTISYYENRHIQDVVFCDSKIIKNEFKSVYGWFQNGSIRLILDTLTFGKSLNEWDIQGNKKSK